MASTNVTESKTTENDSNINLDNIEFPEGPSDEAPASMRRYSPLRGPSDEAPPELEHVKLVNNSDSDDDSESSELVIGKKKEEKKEEEDKEKEPTPKMGLAGLSNMGNTCYLNSVIQVISNMDDFRDFLFKGGFLNDLKKDLDETLYQQLHRIVKHLWDTTSDTLTPKSFREKFIERQKQFYGYEQQDSNEAIQFLLDNLHEETKKKITINYTLTKEMTIFTDILNKYFTNKDKFSEEEKQSKKLQIKKLIQENRMYSLDYFAMKYLNEISNSYSDICEYFGIINCQLKKCPECNHIKYNFEQNYMIHVTLPELDDDTIKNMDVYSKLFEMKKEELKEKVSSEDLISKLCINEIRHKYTYNLDELLIHNQIPEIMDEHNLWNCNNCLKKVKAIAQPKLLKTSKYLIIHFKRFNHIIQNDNTIIFKIKNLIKYNKYINIENLMIKETGNIKYELISGITHMGEYNGGHFTSFAKNNDKWYSYNDSRVNEIKIDKEDVPLSPNAYMLIYKICD
jgi:ubiquitin C-terminal hydrolase